MPTPRRQDGARSPAARAASGRALARDVRRARARGWRSATRATRPVATDARAVRRRRPGARLPASPCSTRRAPTAMVAEIERDWGAVDILVNNAGISQNLPLALMEEDDWDRVMDVNVKGTFLTSRAVAARDDPAQARRRPEHRLARRRADDRGAGPLLREQGRDQGADRGAGEGGRALRHPRDLPGARPAGGRRRPQSARASARRLSQALRARPRRHARRGRALRRVPRLRTPTATCPARRWSSTEACEAWTPPRRSAIVFGGSGAVGREVCRTLAARGARVGFTFLTNETVARELTDGHPGSTARGSTCRRRRHRADAGRVRTREIGRIDAFVNCAAVGVDRSRTTARPATNVMDRRRRATHGTR